MAGDSGMLHLLLVFLIGFAAGVLLSVQQKVAVLIFFIFCACGLVVVSTATRGLAEVALSLLIVTIAMQVGYMAGLFLQAIWPTGRATKNDTDPAITRRRL